MNNPTRNRARKFLALVECHNLHHVKTLPYNHVQAVLQWLGVKPSDFPSVCEEDTVTVVNRFVREHGLRNVKVTNKDETLLLKGTEHTKHKHSRPGVKDLAAKLWAMGGNIVDRYFAFMGVLCITLYPQERWSPSKLLNLPRYQYLREDVGEAHLTPSQHMPLSVKVGEYQRADIMGDNNLDTMVRNIVLRMKVKIFKSLKVSSIGLHPGFDQGDSLLEISNIEQFQQSAGSGVCFTQFAILPFCNLSFHNLQLPFHRQSPSGRLL